jgi:hypothetical protein
MRCSSVVVPLDDAGFGEKKSRRLNPFQRGSVFLGAGHAKALSVDIPKAAAASPVLLINALRSIEIRN